MDCQVQYVEVEWFLSLSHIMQYTLQLNIIWTVKSHMSNWQTPCWFWKVIWWFYQLRIHKHVSTLTHLWQIQSGDSEFWWTAKSHIVYFTTIYCTIMFNMCVAAHTQCGLSLLIQHVNQYWSGLQSPIFFLYHHIYCTIQSGDSECWWRLTLLGSVYCWWHWGDFMTWNYFQYCLDGQVPYCLLHHHILHNHV